MREQLMQWGILLCFYLWAVVFVWHPIATLAGTLADRLDHYPQWNSKPAVASAVGDLAYPDWLEGTWTVTSTLVEQVAPLAPEIVTPGFESSRRYLQQPITFQVKFEKRFVSTLPILTGTFLIVADRAFNGLNIAQAYLGKERVLSVKVDPQNPNRQITFLKGDYGLIATVTGRASENSNAQQFIATEITQQMFKSSAMIYLNEVESTTAYQLLPSGNIIANQITAIYLSPKDPNYFKAFAHPVALYKYQLDLTKLE